MQYTILAWLCPTTRANYNHDTFGYSHCGYAPTTCYDNHDTFGYDNCRHAPTSCYDDTPYSGVGDNPPTAGYDQNYNTSVWRQEAPTYDVGSSPGNYCGLNYSAVQYPPMCILQYADKCNFGDVLTGGGFL